MWCVGSTGVNKNCSEDSIHGLYQSIGAIHYVPYAPSCPPWKPSLFYTTLAHCTPQGIGYLLTCKTTGTVYLGCSDCRGIFRVVANCLNADFIKSHMKPDNHLYLSMYGVKQKGRKK